MYIVSLEDGRILASFDKWDLSSVKKAEAWLSEHGMVILKCGMSIMGTFIVTVIRK